uniref:NAB domain-containing protein n=1 Tax=Leersia perrieri TaxID=77586 RepID=A0A0D9UX78_9ORYZ
MKPPLERNPTKKRHSWWWDSHISPKNSKWLAENLEEMDKQVKEMLQLIEEDGDSFAKKAQMYYQRRPMLITHVENFYRMYRALAERYDNVTGELRKNIPTRLQYQGSLTGSESGSEIQRSPSPSPEPQKSWTREQSPRAAGFDVFLSNKSNGSPASRKEPEDLASQSESEAKSEDGDDDGIAYTLHQRILELEDELNTVNQKLRDANEKLEVLEEKSLRCRCDSKENGNSDDQSATKEKLQSSQEEINNLKISLEVLSEENSRLLGQNKKLEAEIVNLKGEIASDRRQFEEKLSHSDAEIDKCRQELAEASEKLLQEKSANSSVTKELQETIESIRLKLEKVSEEKLLVEDKFKKLEEANSEAEKYNQELFHATERLSEEKFRHEAEILTLNQAIEDLKSKLERLAQERSLFKSWFADLEQVVERGRRILPE